MGNHSGKKMKTCLAVLALAALLANSCTRVTPLAAKPTETTLPPIPTATATATPTAISTPTPEATATAEIKQFKVCTPEQFQNCEISPDDLLNGNYLRWLQTLSKPFNPAKIKDVQLFDSGGLIYYNLTTSPNFKDPSTAPFRKGITVGYTNYQGLLYVVLPVEYYDRANPTRNQWVITLSTISAPLETWINGDSPVYNIIEKFIEKWAKSDSPMFLDDDISNRQLHTIDPLVSKTFELHPEMKERFTHFINGDPSALSAPGIVLFSRVWN